MWRWFYSTEESDTALKGVLDSSKFSKEYTRNENGLTDGVFEYKVWIEQDSEFELLSSKIDSLNIRALASPDRVPQFGNIRPDNYFDTTKYASGCAYRDTDSLENMIMYLSAFRSGKRIAQRDIDIQGSATLGTVSLVLSSLYKKTYNIPVNGSVSDRTLIKADIDNTPPSVIQTNAICNQAMFDYADPYGYTINSIDVDPSSGTKAEFIAKSNDRKISILADSYYHNESGTTSKTFIIDYGQILTNVNIFLMWKATIKASDGGSPWARLDIYSSSDGVSWSSSLYTHIYTGVETTQEKNTTLTGKTFRYLKFVCLSSYATYNYYRFQPREILVS